MGHEICAILTKETFDPQIAERYDLFGVSLPDGITMFHIDQYYTACWQKLLNVEGDLEGKAGHPLVPNDAVIHTLMTAITGIENPVYAVILTDYFGGVGWQCAQVYRGSAVVNPEIRFINQALAQLGVVAEPGLDEFDTVGLGNYRSQPEFLEKYRDLMDELYM